MSTQQDAPSRALWEHRMSFFGLAFAGGTQVYPRTGDKKVGGSVRPSTTTEPNNQLEKTEMETTQATNGHTTDRPFDMSPEEARKLVGDLTIELQKSRSLPNRLITGAVIASGVGVGTGVALTVYHLATKK